MQYIKKYIYECSNLMINLTHSPQFKGRNKISYNKLNMVNKLRFLNIGVRCSGICQINSERFIFKACFSDI